MAHSSPANAGMLAARLQSIRYAAKDVLLFEFVALDGPFPAATPGAHLDIALTGEMRRQYSLVTPMCSASSYVVAVKREDAGRGGSLWLHEQARVGSKFDVSRPRNNFELDEDAQQTILVAGGIGITPLYSMLARLKELGRPVRLHYWSRSAECTLFRTELERDPDVVLYHSSTAGRVSAGEILSAYPSGADIYACGPSRMLSECIAFVERCPGSRLHLERFAGEPVNIDQQAAASGSFVVGLARKGIDVPVGEGQTILEALIAANIDVPYSCEEGVCGACEAKVLSGDPLHRDSVRSPAANRERGTIMICCSRSNTDRLLLDI